MGKGHRGVFPEILLRTYCRNQRYWGYTVCMVPGCRYPPVQFGECLHPIIMTTLSLFCVFIAVAATSFIISPSQLMNILLVPKLFSTPPTIPRKSFGVGTACVDLSLSPGMTFLTIDGMAEAHRSISSCSRCRTQSGLRPNSLAFVFATSATSWLFKWNDKTSWTGIVAALFAFYKK